MDATTQGKTMRRGFWAVVIFYLLIAFEFFYMASPFAVYFYSVYRPGLDFMNKFPQLAWLAGFFLPHIVAETSSILINLHTIAGIALSVGGILAFSVGAGQVYYHKLTKKGSVIGGVYRSIRHPQYLLLAICGLGLLLVWPRYIVLVMYVTVLFAYWLLARLEERECLAKFGRSYEDYMKRTGMFLPFKLPSVTQLRRPGASRATRAAILVGVYMAAVAAGLGAAAGVERLSIGSLYGNYTDDSATLSLVKMDSADIRKILGAALADSRVAEKLTSGGSGSPATYLNYVLPADRYVSEIPMNVLGADEGNHFLAFGYDGRLYRVVITRAVLRDGDSAKGRDIVRSATGTIPLVEVVVDARDLTVVGVEAPAVAERYENIPMPVF